MPAPPSAQERKRAREIAQLERDLAAATRRHRERADALQGAEAQRDRVIRDAHAAGIPPARIMEITGLSKPRVHQIRHGARS